MEKAHQRLIRERKAEEGGDLFGKWWEKIDLSIDRAVVKEIDRATCESIILEYEWLGCMPAVVWHMYGIFFDGHCGGVVCYGPEYSENSGATVRSGKLKGGADWSTYGFEGKMILLSRGACVHWAHPHAGSKLIRRSMDLLPARYEVVTATTDQAAGEIGTIYQACGFHYVGAMRKVAYRDGWLINGKLYGSRSLRSKIGCTKWEVIKARYPDAKKVKQHSKHRYFAFRGGRLAKRRHLKAIAHIVKPYPKRKNEECS
jgi:hypothetical protein